MSIITQTNSTSEEFSHSISNFFHRFHLSDALKKSNAKHKKGHPVSVIFLFYWLRFLPMARPIALIENKKKNSPFPIKRFEIC